MNRSKNKYSLGKWLLNFILLVFSISAYSQNTFPACDGRLYYFAESATNLTLTYVDQYSTSNVVSTVVCPLSNSISTKANALGANPVDKFLYFIEKDDVSGDVVIRRLNKNCNAPIVCPANNNPAIPFAKAACFDTLGRYWVLDGNQLSAWDLTTCKIVKGPFFVPTPSNDIVFNPWDCCLYSGTNKIDLNGNVTTITGTSINGPGFAMGLDGKVYAIQGGSADSMELTRYDLVTGTKATVGYIKPGSVNGSDMASIPCAIINALFVPSPPTCPPSTINFTDKSTGIITNWNWDFGDGSTSLLQNPSHVFSSSGTYTVKLTVSTTNTCIVVTPSTYTLTVTIPPLPIITVNSAAICAGKSSTLTGSGAVTYTWAPSTGLSSGTGTSVTANPTTSTTYTITGTSAAGCTNTTTAVVTVNPNPIVSVPTPAAICTGGSTTLTASGATTYTWAAATGLSSTTGTSVTANPTSTTTYTVTGSDPTGCTGTTTVVVTVTPTTITVPSTSICQGQSGTLTASGASTYVWAPASSLSSSTGNSVTANPTTTTTYTITGTTAGGCTASTMAIVTVNPPCGVFVNVTGSTICEGECGTATATAGGSTGPYTYLWNTGGTGTTITACPTTTTSYTVTATDNLGATAKNTTSIIVNPLPVVAVPAAVICNGTTTTLTASGATTYTWAPGTGLSSTTGSPVTASPTVTTTYTVTGAFATGCTGTTTVVVTVNPIPVVIVPNANICPGGATPLTASGATTYTWSLAAGLSSTTGTTVTANPVVNTTYTVIGTANGCTSSTTVSVTIGALVADAGPDVAICFGVSINLNASGGTIYTWTPATGLNNSTISNPIASPTVTTTYTVNVSDGSCSDVDEVIVTVNPLTTLNAAGIDVTCFGACDGQIIVIPNGGTSPYTYSWSSGCTAAACNNICAGTYSLVTTDAVGCTATATVTVNEPALLTSAITGKTNVTCFGVCDGTAVVSANGGTSPYIYSWNSTPVQTSANATGLCAGSFTVTITDANGCTTTASVTITQPTPVVVISSNAGICPNTCATLIVSASGGTGAIGFLWNLGVTTNAVSVCPANTTTYTITGTDANGCTGVTSVVVTLQPVPVIVVPGATICQGTSTVLTASGANTYSWATTNGLNAATGTSVTANPSVTTTYTVTGTNSFGCTGTTTVIVTVNTAPVITPNPANMCPGDSVALTASGAITYTWSPATGLSSTTGAVVIAKPSATASYIITGTGSNGCTSSTTVIVTVHPKPVASFSSSPNPVTIFNPTVYFKDQSSGAVTWNWKLGDPTNSGSNDKDPFVIYPDTGRYVVQLIVTNIFGCIDTTEQVIFIKGEYTFFIPNTFTPNGDGTNDGFSPKGTGIDIKDYNLWIFDRWGNFIWETSIWGEQWDGRANGGADCAQIDTYVWKVHVRELDSQLVHDYIGHVNIVK